MGRKILASIHCFVPYGTRYIRRSLDFYPHFVSNACLPAMQGTIKLYLNSHIKKAKTERSVLAFFMRNIFQLQDRNLYTKSHKTIPALTEMLNECLVPYCGISIAPSHKSMTDC